MAELDRQKVISGIQRTLKDLLFTETDVFYYHLESIGVKRDEILDKPEKFVKTIHDIFGNGSVLVENAIMTEMTKELDIKPEKDLEEMLRLLCGRSR
jgi:lipid II:glycine glycyltransferase (peptidoglycan interpeptide bridge formation enzyme)